MSSPAPCASGNSRKPSLTVWVQTSNWCCPDGMVWCRYLYRAPENASLAQVKPLLDAEKFDSLMLDPDLAFLIEVLWYLSVAIFCSFWHEICIKSYHIFISYWPNLDLPVIRWCVCFVYRVSVATYFKRWVLIRWSTFSLSLLSSIFFCLQGISTFYPGSLFHFLWALSVALFFLICRKLWI